MRYLSLAGFLFAFWPGLSGHYAAILISAGAVSAVVCVLAAIRIRAADAEGRPIEVLRRALICFPWLIVEIAKSGWSVTKVILHPSLPTSPTITAVGPYCAPDDQCRAINH